ncbi:reverse transcriptase [Lasius niger]|uniref:Reverse transcriptase n=1 Tax=Lasius niger TaxID=67767 RepID=A0A0J7NCG4_LASNI|nr:reverse transcriptase [Lasius niger]
MDTPVCEHCDFNQIDTAEHTLQDCRAWSANREALTGIIGDNLDLEIVTRAICEKQEAWFAFSQFAKKGNA